MSDLQLSRDQLDALQEVANIGMGQAGAALAGVLDTYVNLSVPRIQVIKISNLGGTLLSMVGGDPDVTAVRQSFRSEMRGEAVVIFGQGGCSALWDLMGYDQADQASGPGGGREVLLDVANILAGACIRSVFEQLGHSLTFSPPSLIAEHIPIERLLRPGTLPWEIALLVEVNFRMETRQFICHLLMLMPEESIEQMKRALDHFLANL
jgi:chemotaxis protein CheC